MDWTTYHRDVDITANGNTHNLKIDNLTVRANPFLYTGDESLSQQLFDGRHVQQLDGWHHQVDMEWGELTQTLHDDLRAAINDTVTGGEATIDFDPVNDPGNKTLTVVIESVSEAVQSVFEGGVRQRPASMTWVTVDTQSEPATWLTT